jgi:hypothetical protein
MNEKNPSYFLGRISFDRLFLGSKSEGLYPVLHTDQNLSYRLHKRGAVLSDESPLLPFNGKNVKVLGFADNTRGHWRIVLDDEDSCVIYAASPDGLNDTTEAIRKAEPSPANDGDSEAAS